MNAIEARGLTKRYGDVLAVDRLDLTVGEGEFLSLLGVNGAGKTTTVRMLTCLTAPSEGDAFLLGHSIRTESVTVKSVIAVSPQETAVAQNLTVRENLELICSAYGFSAEKSRQKTAEVVSLLSLQEIVGRRAGKLSGGWQRRLSIAMALIGEPKILFLDEPTLGLDVIARRELWDVLRTLRGRVTLILTTHYMEEAEELSDRIAIMKDGRLLLADTPDAIKARTGKESFEDAFISVVRGEVK